MDLIFSVIICTYNRADFLQAVLNDLCSQDCPKKIFEVLVIDNNSVDNTREIVSFFLDKLNVSYFFEKESGLSKARNLGYRKAKGRYIAYTDDDCQLPVNWLSNAAVLAESKKHLIFGGPVWPFYISKKPHWYKDKYALLGFGSSNRILKSDEYLFGGNIFISRKVFEKSGSFDENLGMKGKNIGYGEDTELQMRARAIMDSNIIYYSTEIYVRHLMRPEKLNWNWIVHSFINKGRDNYKMKVIIGSRTPDHSVFKLFFRLSKSFFSILYHVVIGWLFRSRDIYPYRQNYIFEKCQGHLWNIGYFIQQLRYFFCL